MNYAPKCSGLDCSKVFYNYDEIGTHKCSEYAKEKPKQSSIETAFTAVPARSITRVAAILKTGREKYGADNWRNISRRDHLDHALAHIYSYLAGNEVDEDDLGNATCRLLFALDTQ